MGVDRSVRNRPPHTGPPVTPETIAPRPLSPRNPRVSHLAKLVRQRRVRDLDGLFVIDGPVLLAEAVRDGVLVDDVYLAPGALDDPAVAAAAAAAASDCAHVWEVDGGLDGFVDPTTPHGVAAVAQRPGTIVPSGTPALHVVLVGVADPGNVGTLLRTAEAVGAHTVVLTDGTADAWSPKVVRASAGSVWRSMLERGSARLHLARLRDEGATLVGAAGGVGERPDRIDLTGPVALVLGSEAHGLPDEIAGVIDAWASLPMEGAVESLNVAVAGSVLAFEVVRQRAVAAEAAGAVAG